MPRRVATRASGLGRAGTAPASRAVAPPPTRQQQPSAARPPGRLLATVDIGSRALRLAIGEVVAGQPVKRLESASVPMAVGIDTFSRGGIRAATTEDVVRTLEEFSRILAAYGLTPADCRATATTAVRDARNREVFLDRVTSRTGFRVEVIEAIEETRLVHQLVRHLLGAAFERGHVMLLALGAGGTHVIVQQDGRLRLAETLHFGLLRLAQGTAGDPITRRGARRFVDKVVRSIDRLHDLHDVDRLVVVNSELYRVAAALGSPRRTPAGLSMTRAALRRLGQVLEQYSARELAEESGLDQAAAELARLAFAELEAFCQPTRASHVVLPESSMLDSLLLDARLRSEPQTEGVADQQQVTEAAAWAVARRYRTDELHAAKVRALALELYDGLQPLLGLGPRSRLLLSVAAILHEVGLFVSTHAHGQHSAYLIANSEIMGLTGEELQRVALVARHHRRADRGIASLELGPLPAGQRVELLKLISVLRLADALDADQQQGVVQLTVQVEGEELRVRAATHRDDPEVFADLLRVFRDKGELFQDVFGLTPTLTEVLVA
ncbi:MAG: HD domain-containing protein [Proteobacteria bacterium]|nr:HD domain-containing protein [Pseudomonadota bacterium]